MAIKNPKWLISSAINAGINTVELTNKYQTDVEVRLKPGELNELKKEIKILEMRRSGQKEMLTSQKAKTGTQDEKAKMLHEFVMDLRQMVKTVTNDQGIRKTFGVGESIHANSVSQVVAGANMIIDGYEKYTDWANNEAGLIDADMDEITGLLNELKEADTEQEVSKMERKLTTMDKDVLQRSVEDKVTKISAIGVRTFGRKDPAIAKLFADLIPNN